MCVIVCDCVLVLKCSRSGTPRANTGDTCVLAQSI